MGAPEPIYYTAEMVRALNAAEPLHAPRYETVHGELLVSPSPGAQHQAVVTRLAHYLMGYLEREPVGEVFVSPSDISWGLPDVLVQPDVFVIPAAASRPARADGWTAVRDLMLGAEVLSASSPRADRFTKRRLYQERAVPLYWILDPESRVAELWTPNDTFPRFERERLVWHPAGAATPFVLDLPTLFAEP